MNLRDAFDPPVPAIVLAEGEFGRAGGKTANGVVMHSELFETKVVIDSDTAGESSVSVLNNSTAPDIPIVASIDEAIREVSNAEALVVGVAPAGGELPQEWVNSIEIAIESGHDIVSGLHVFLSENEYWNQLAEDNGARLFDVRKPPAGDDLRVGDGSVDDVDADIVLTLGTDCAVGKRTTTFELYRAARESGLDAGWVATGQTGIMIGAHAGVAIDRVPADFTAGVVEESVKTVGATHDIVFVEGQACLTHRAYSGVTLSILHGSWPDVVVLADEPRRRDRAHFEQFPIEGVEKEQRLIQAISDARVVALSTWGDPETIAERYELPAANVFEDDGPKRLLEMVRDGIKTDAVAERSKSGADSRGRQ